MKNAVATQILSQLGGNKFIAMTGVKNLGCDETSLQMKLPRNKSKATHLVITLNSMDLYDVEFVNCRNYQRITVEKLENVYGDMLQSVFTGRTGLLTSLGTMVNN